MADYLNLPPIERWITYIAIDADPKEGYFPAETINFESEAKKRFADCDGSRKSGNNELIHEIYNVLFAWEKEGDNFEKQTDNPKAKMILENCLNEISAIE